METEIKKEVETSNKEVKVKSFKAFESDWTCRGFKYEVGKTYSIGEEEPIVCERGFHSCTNLRDCFDYYPLAQWTKFALVEASGIIYHSEKNSKIVSSKIKIIKELFFDDIIKMIATNDADVEENILNCYSTSYSKNVIDSKSVFMCEGVNKSSAVCKSGGVNKSDSIHYSKGIATSFGVNQSFGIYNCSAINNSASINSSKGISSSQIIDGSNAIFNSSMVTYSHGLSKCKLIENSEGLHNSYGVKEGFGVDDSFGIDNCYGINNSKFLNNCYGVSDSLFCSDIKNRYFLFNKKVRKERFDEVNNEIQKLTINWIPEPNNGNMLFVKKRDKYEQNVSPTMLSVNKNMNINMPEELIKYIKSLPEYDEEIFNYIVYGEQETENEDE